MAYDLVPAVTGLATPSKVTLGCFAFVAWWVFAVFPAVPFLPIGRTAGSLLGATLMVIFLVISPDEAFEAIDLAILALLFGTMVVSEYLIRADLFKYLGDLLAWKSKGAMDLLCRVCLLAALSSALFTNDTTCVVLTPFVLKLCREQTLHPKPFLLALACSSNIGSAATAIGNPQNLVIAVNSGISFGRFLAGVFPAMALGLVVNTLLLLAAYGRSLAGHHWCALQAQPEISEDLGNGRVQVTIVWNPATEKTCIADHEEPRPELAPPPDADVAPPSPVPLNPFLSAAAPSAQPDGASGPTPRNAGVEIVVENLRGAEQISSDLGRDPAVVKEDHAIPDSDAPVSESGTSVHRRKVQDSAGDGAGSLDIAGKGAHGYGENASVHLKKRGIVSKAFALYTRIVHENGLTAMFERRLGKYKKRIWKACVYLVTLGMLAALLAGLSLPWTALTAAVLMMVLDFSDAGPSLDKVNYALLVFFCGMFIATSGFNLTGVPAVFWSAVEPYSHISTASGVILLSVVVTVLSNVVSNVPTVILLGTKVAASAVASGASPDKAWLILAWVSTVAGNLTLLGSAANIIVAEQARESRTEKENREKQSKEVTSGSSVSARATYDLTFWEHLKFGFPSTIIVIAVGLVPIALRKF